MTTTGTPSLASTTLSQPRPPSTAGERLRWAAIDSWVVAKRSLLHWIAMPGQIIAGLIFPIMFVLLFGYVFGSGMVAPEGGSYQAFLMPGLFVLTMAFGIGETMVAVQADSERGIGDRFRSMPMAQSAVVTGRSIADMISSVFGLTAMIIAGLVVGWRATEGPAATAAAIGLLFLLRFAFLWIGIYLGLIVRSAEQAGAVWSLLFPVTMLTNAFVDPSMMPTWLGWIAMWNPLSSTVSATRELFGNPVSDPGSSWIAQNAILMAAVWPLLIIAVFFPLAVRRYRSLSR